MTELRPGEFPDFEGTLSFDEAVCESAAEDLGHLSRKRPLAVLFPRAVEDISRLIRFARARGLKVAVRGQGHSTGGQPLAEGGIIIQLSECSRIRSIESEFAWVDAGLTWFELLTATLAVDRMPPTLADTLCLSIGGTLSVGGVGGRTFHHGTQADNVLALEVVTGTGEIIECSPEREPDLFDACRAGIGQFGVITAAKLKLIEAPTRVRTYEALYLSSEPFLDLQFSLNQDGRFDYVGGVMAPLPSGEWGFLLQVSKFYRAPEEPSDAALLAALAPAPAALTTSDRGAMEFFNRTASQLEDLKAAGLWSTPHPWLTQFLARSDAGPYLASLGARLKFADLGQGAVGTYPLLRSSVQAPFLSLPETEEIFILILLANADPPTEERAAELLKVEQALYEEGMQRGGKIYPIGFLPQGEEWERHYGPRWERFVAIKDRFDPDRILNPGPAIAYPPRGGH